MKKVYGIRNCGDTMKKAFAAPKLKEWAAQFDAAL